MIRKKHNHFTPQIQTKFCSIIIWDKLVRDILKDIAHLRRQKQHQTSSSFNITNIDKIECHLNLMIQLGPRNSHP